MTGWLITNQFLKSAKFDELKEKFESAAKEEGIELIALTNTGASQIVNQSLKKERPDFVLFWDKDVLLASYFEAEHIPVFNSSRAIEVCDNKCLTHLALKKAGLPMPDTIFAPMTYSNVGYSDLDFLSQIEEVFSYPIIVKEAYGSFGAQVYFVENRKQLIFHTKRLEGTPFLYQKYIESSYGRDVRLQVVGEQVVAAMYRYSDSDFRANVSAGGSMRAYEPDESQCELAVKACRAVGADFAGVDLLFGEDGEMLVCEVNSNAHFKNIETCTGVNSAEWILRYIKGKCSQ